MPTHPETINHPFKANNTSKNAHDIKHTALDSDSEYDTIEQPAPKGKSAKSSRLQLESMIDDSEDGEQDFGRKLTHIVKIGYLRTRDNKVHKICYVDSESPTHGSHTVRVSNNSGQEMSRQTTMTPYAFVIGKKRHFRFSHEKKNKLLSKDRDRRPDRTMEKLCVCIGCGKTVLNLVHDKIKVQDWYIHKIRCLKLQALLHKEFETQGEPTTIAKSGSDSTTRPAPSSNPVPDRTQTRTGSFSNKEKAQAKAPRTTNAPTNTQPAAEARVTRARGNPHTEVEVVLTRRAPCEPAAAAHPATQRPVPSPSVAPSTPSSIIPRKRPVSETDNAKLKPEVPIKKRTINNGVVTEHEIILPIEYFSVDEIVTVFRAGLE